MASVRLRPDQITRLRETGNAAAVIRHAVMRYRRGDFPVLRAKKERGKLAVLSLWKEIPGISGAKLRAILDAHFSKPDAVHQAKCKAEIEELNEQIAGMMGLYAVRPDRAYILAEDTEENDD